MAPIERAQSTVKRFQDSGPGRFLAKYGQDQADDHAALIAFSALFSLFPLIGALLTLLGLIVRDQQTLEKLIATINQLFPAQLADLLSFLQETREITGLLGVVSFVGLLWSASAIFGSCSRLTPTACSVAGWPRSAISFATASAAEPDRAPRASRMLSCLSLETS